MIERVLRVVALLAIVAAGLGAYAPTPIHAAPGDSPNEAIPIDDNSDFTFFGALDAGQVRWYRVYNAGNGIPLGITMHLRPEDIADRNSIQGFVNIPRPIDGALGEPDQDAVGYNRLGAIERTNNTGENRKFWLNFEGNIQPYYIKVVNYTNRTIGFAMTIKQSDQPAEYVIAPDPSQVTDPSAPLTPAGPTPTPTEPAPKLPVGTGSSPDEALYVDTTEPTTYQGTIQRGERRWLKVEYPGENRPFGVTLSLSTNEDADDLRNLNVFVNVRTTEGTLGENNVDWADFSRIGWLMPVSNNEPHHRFWTSVSSVHQTYFLVIQNFSTKPLDVALTFTRSDTAASYVMPTGSTLPAEEPGLPVDPGALPEPTLPELPFEPGTDVELGAETDSDVALDPAPVPAPSVADVVLGTTPLQAAEIALDNGTAHGVLGTGLDFWYRFDYPGDNAPVGVTLHLPASADAAVLEGVSALVNVRRGEDADGADWPGFERIGQTTSAQGLTRQFWTATTGDAQTYYIRIQNHSGQDVPYILTVNRSGEAAGYIDPLG